MADAFDMFPGRDSAEGDAFDQFPIPQESFGKNAARTALQIPQGITEATPPGIITSLWSLLGQGEVNDPEELDRIKSISEREGIPFDEQGYQEAGQNALGYIPTVSNIGREIESKTGLPLEPKTKLQKFARLSSLASKGIPKANTASPKGYAVRGTNTGLPRPVLGAGVGATSQVLQKAGVPEPFADVASFGIVKPTTAESSRISVGPKTKESGLTSRQYEKLTSPKEVSASKINQINQAVENEVRNITNQIIQKSPVAETYASLANDIGFKNRVSEGFKQVEGLAESLPQTFQTKMIKNDLQKLISGKQNAGLTPSEFDKSYSSFLKEFIKETPEKPFTAAELVSQFRKNNKQLTEAYEPGQSFAYNRAKRESLSDYNKVIADMIEKEFPNTEFSNLFKETNKQWAEISNAEAIDKFLDKLFKDGINYQNAKQLFAKEGMTVPFKRALGKEGYSRFETLMNDLLSTEKGHKLLKHAQAKGWDDLAKTAGAYVLHPTAAQAKFGWDTLKGGYKKIFEMLLDKPQIGLTWDRGINAMKRGDYKAATTEFSALKKAEEAFDAKNKAKMNAIKKFNERNKLLEAPNPKEKLNDNLEKQVKAKYERSGNEILDLPETIIKTEQDASKYLENLFPLYPKNKKIRFTKDKNGYTAIIQHPTFEIFSKENPGSGSNLYGYGKNKTEAVKSLSKEIYNSGIELGNKYPEVQFANYAPTKKNPINKDKLPR